MPSKMETPISRFEAYLQGTPLNAELAAVQQGQVSLAEPPAMPEKAPQHGAIEDVERELNRAERLDLKELRTSDGWPVLMRIMEKRLQKLHKAAITMSQNDPLGNSQSIAQSWAYVVLYRRAKREMEALLDEELNALREEQ